MSFVKTDIINENTDDEARKILDRLGVPGNLDEDTFWGKLNSIYHNMFPRYRSDDCLKNAYTSETISTEETIATYNNEALIGTITNIPSGCFRIEITAEMMRSGGSVSIYLKINGEKGTSSSDYWRDVTTDYNVFSKIFEIDLDENDICDLYLYMGSTGTGYCKNVSVKCYYRERSISEEKYEVGTVKNHVLVGSSQSGKEELAEPHRLDRIICLGGSSWNGNSLLPSILEVDGIPYVTHLRGGVYLLLY